MPVPKLLGKSSGDKIKVDPSLSTSGPLSVAHNQTHGSSLLLQGRSNTVVTLSGFSTNVHLLPSRSTSTYIVVSSVTERPFRILTHIDAFPPPPFCVWCIPFSSSLIDELPGLIPSHTESSGISSEDGSNFFLNAFHIKTFYKVIIKWLLLLKNISRHDCQ